MRILSKYMTGIFIVAFVAILIFLITLLIQESDECKARGGEMVGTGEYVTTYVVSSNNVVIPVVNEIVSCSK